MTIRAGDVRAAYPLFQEEGGGSIPTSALQLRFEVIDRTTMESLNQKWHSRLPRLATACPCRVYYGAEFGGLWYAVAAWSQPVARMLPQDWLELRRLAIANDAPKNTATRMIGWMVRDIRKRFSGVTRLVSYQDTAVHTGTIYKAAGWTATTIDAGGEWSRPSRLRNAVQSAAPKQRWEKRLSTETGK